MVSTGEVSAEIEWRKNRVAWFTDQRMSEQGERHKSHPVQIPPFKDEAQRIQLTHLI